MARSKRKWLRYAVIFGLLPVLSACFHSQPIPKVAEETPCKKITVGAGPEDFVLDQWNGSPRLLISCCERRGPAKTGNIWFYDIASGKTGIMKRSGEPARLKAFRPHGVDIRHHDGETDLYVVLHDPYAHGKRLENAVGIYRVSGNRLMMVRLLEDSRHLWSPNDLSVLPSGEIYLTNDYRGNLDLLFGRATSEIAYYSPKTDTWRFVAKNLAFANGILATPERIYVSTTMGNRFMAYPRHPDGTLGKGKMLMDLKGGDNIMRFGRFLLVCAHYDDWAFMRHAKNKEYPSPSVVFRIDLETGTGKAIFADDGNRISAASTAMVYHDKLYISQVFDNYILDCNAPLSIDW